MVKVTVELTIIEINYLLSKLGDDTPKLTAKLEAAKAAAVETD